MRIMAGDTGHQTIVQGQRRIRRRRRDQYRVIVTGRMAEPAHIRLGEYQRAVALFVAQVAKEAVTVSLVDRSLGVQGPGRCQAQ